MLDGTRFARQRGPVAAGLCVLAVVYSAALLVAVAVIPVVDGQTLLGHGGAWTLAIFAQPLLVSGLIWRLLRARCQTGSPRATRVAWTVAPVYLAYSVVGGFSIAAGALPAALLLLVAVALTPLPPATRGRMIAAA